MRWNEGKGWGALQLVGKYDVIDLSSQGFNAAGGCRTPSSIPGISNSAVPANALTAASIRVCAVSRKPGVVGANWYLNDYVRLMFQYSKSDLSGYPVTTIGTPTSGNLTPPPGTKVAGFDGATIRGFGMRAQIDW